MKIVVTDACIFIDLIELRLLTQFFGLNLEVHTTLDVYHELFSNQQEFLDAYKSVKKLTLHNLQPKEWETILNDSFPKSLSDIDKTVIYLAQKISGTILSSDKAIRNYSKQNSIPYHGMLWIFDQLINFELISKQTAVEKINQLVAQNITYQNNAELTYEINKRIQLWEL